MAQFDVTTWSVMVISRIGSPRKQPRHGIEVYTCR